MPDGLQFTNGNTTRYVYDAAGAKLSVTYETAVAGITIPMTNVMTPLAPANILTTTNTDYCGNVIYENSALSRILTEEGYITLSESTPTYHYYLRDHEGNNRVVLNQSGTVEQVNHYYPFGGLMGESTAGGVQPYKYNGKELDRMHGLDLFDYRARHYDAALGRWFVVDPLAEKYYSISLYAYCSNNPIRYIDPTGMDWYEAENGTVTWTDYTSQKDLDDNKIKGTYLGQAHVVFNGSRQEQPSAQNGKNYIAGDGAVNADVTVYGTGGADDIHNFTGYTMTSDPDKYIPIDEGLYSLDYMNSGKGGALPSHWAVNGTGKVPTIDEVPNSNPDTKGEWNYMTPWKTGIYVHSTGKNGGLGTRNSTGCLLILDSQWNDFNSVMQGVTRSSVRVIRTDTKIVPLQGVLSTVPNINIIQKTIRR